MDLEMNFGFMCSGPGEPNDRRVAIIGSGPSGLAAAGELACLGYKVKVYDRMPKAGGLMVFGIPGSRIPAKRIERAAKRLEEQYGVEFHFCAKVCATESECEPGDVFVQESVSLPGLIADNDAVLICTGSWKSRRMGIPGEELAGVYSGLEFLFPLRACKIGGGSVPMPEIEGRRVAVVGAGHSAIDVCSSALKHKAAEVHLIYRRTISEAPAGSYEISLLGRRGVRWTELTRPLRVVGTTQVEGLELQSQQCSAPDRSGRARPMPADGSSYVLPVDLVVYAIGEVPAPPFAKELGLEHMSAQRVNWLQMTKLKGVFVAGDALTGPSKIGRAIFSGLKAASFLDRWLELKSQGREIEYVPEEEAGGDEEAM